MSRISSPLPATVEVEDFAFQHSSPHSLRQPYSSPPAPDSLQTPLDYTFSTDDYDDSNSATDADEIHPTENDNSVLSVNDRRISGISSISSFPVSISRNGTPAEPLRTPLRSPDTLAGGHSRIGSTNSKSFSPRGARDYNAAFRNPSSVLAMQMKDEDSEYIIPPYRRSNSHHSGRSQRSSYSVQNSPTKHFGRSSQSSPQKGSKLKKEFPLVLLHCSLLAPAGNFNASGCDPEVLAAILPDEYRTRWVLLHNSLSSSEVKTRGVLIPHPQEDYEMLEERLLESLELERPRIRQSHYFKHSQNGGDSGFESSSQPEEDTDSDLPGGIKCYDCGRKVRDEEDVDRKWEIKVYAANGLMRAGAWNAAWREMEKVDVEIGLWLPEDVKRDVNSKLEAIEASELNATSFPTEAMHPEVEHKYGTREREIYGHASRAPSQEEIDGFISEQPRFDTRPTQHHVPQTTQPDLQVLLSNYIKLVLGDRRNVVILVLSMLVLVSAVLGGINGGRHGSDAAVLQPNPVEVLTTTVTSTAVWTSTMTTNQDVETAVGSPEAVGAPDGSHHNAVEDVIAKVEKVGNMIVDLNPLTSIEEE